MMSFQRPVLLVAFLSTSLWAGPSFAADCASASDRACIAGSILSATGAITEERWHDTALRDLAGSLTYDGRIDEAIALIDKIGNADTQAMTIRMIGMNAALYRKDSAEDLRGIFAKLAARAAKISDPDANAIAFTYIAMAQAFAKLDADAEKTASGMANAALRNKAFGETAEIQAERGDLAAAMTSIAKIDTASFRNKAYQKVAEILIKEKRFDDALVSAQKIDNAMKRAQTLQGLLAAQEAETRGPRNDAAVDAGAE